MTLRIVFIIYVTFRSTWVLDPFSAQSFDSCLILYLTSSFEITQCCFSAQELLPMPVAPTALSGLTSDKCPHPGCLFSHPVTFHCSLPHHRQDSVTSASFLTLFLSPLSASFFHPYFEHSILLLMLFFLLVYDLRLKLYKALY